MVNLGDVEERADDEDHGKDTCRAADPGMPCDRAQGALLQPAGHYWQALSDTHTGKQHAVEVCSSDLSQYWLYTVGCTLALHKLNRQVQYPLRQGVRQAACIYIQLAC